MLHVMCHVSHVKYHISHFKCHILRVTCHNYIFLFSDKVVELVGGGSVINGAYPPSNFVQAVQFVKYPKGRVPKKTLNL